MPDKIVECKYCQLCQDFHPAEQPHCNSNFIITFFLKNDRFPVWADAIADCPADIQEILKDIDKKPYGWVDLNERLKEGKGIK